MLRALLCAAFLLVVYLNGGHSSSSINGGVVKAFQRQMVSLVD